MQYLIAAVLLLVATQAEAKVNCKVHPIFCKIKKLNTRLSDDKAMEISNHIHKWSQLYKIDPSISIAILMQENRFRDKHTFEVSKQETMECNHTSCYRQIHEVHEVVDMGIAQINIRTAVAYDFDLDKLFDHDLGYAIECHFKILKHKMDMCEHLGDKSWSCYHSATPTYRLKYVDMVSRYM